MTHTQRSSLYSRDAARDLHDLIAKRYGITTEVENTGGHTMVQVIRNDPWVITLGGETIAECVIALWTSASWDGETSTEPLLIQGLTGPEMAAYVKNFNKPRARGIHEYHCETCHESFVGDGAPAEEHHACGTLCLLLGSWTATTTPPPRN